LFKRWYQSSLRHQILIWLLLINFFVLILMAIATLQVSRNSVEKNIYEQLEREHLIESEIIESSLNRMVGEMQAFGASFVLTNALNSPEKAKQILEPFVSQNALIKVDHNDFYLLDANGHRIYATSDSDFWVEGSNALAKDALGQLRMQAAIFRVGNRFVLQIAQPIEGRGVAVFSQSINQLLEHFFQGRKDISAWVLESKSGEALSSMHEPSALNSNIAQDLFSKRDHENSIIPSPASGALPNPAWKTIKGPLRLVPPLSNLQLQLVLNERTNWTQLVTLQLLWPFIAVLVLVSLVAGSIITIAGRRLATPIEVLANYALSVEKAGFSESEERHKLTALLSREDEVGRLSAQFNQMLQRLRHSYAGLEDQMAQRNAQLESIFELSPDGFIEIESNGEVGFVNPAFQTLTSLSAIGIVGKPVSQLIEKLHGLASNSSLSQIKTILESAEKLHWLELNIPYKRTLLVLTKRNQLNGYVVYMRDVTQEAELEEMRSAFMSTAAHELRTPISSILGYAELLMRRLKGGIKPSEEVIEEIAKVIERQSKSMADLVNDLLDLSRLENQMAKGLNLHATSLAIYLRPVVAQFEMPGDEREVVMYVDDNLPDVELHPESFKRLIVNLLSNALKYSSKGSPVIVKTFTQKIEDKLYVGISVKDYGDGMSLEDLKNAFERFYRSSSHELIPGTGLGLAIAKEIMHAHSGEIKIESALGEGTTVTLLFPAIRTWGRSNESLRSE
jgi:PAS domain S-box-containing protein